MKRQQRTWFSGPRIRRRGSTLDAGSWTAIRTGRVPQPVRVLAVVESGTQWAQAHSEALLRRPSPCIDLRERSSIRRHEGSRCGGRRRGIDSQDSLPAWDGGDSRDGRSRRRRISVRAPRRPLRKVSAVRSHPGPPELGTWYPSAAIASRWAVPPCRASPQKLGRASLERGLLLPMDIDLSNG
jgi:hypothetical protein